MQNYVTWIQIVLSLILKVKMFLTLIDHYLQGKKSDWIDERWICDRVTLRPKKLSYLMGDGNSDKKAKGTKKCVMKRRLKFNDYKDVYRTMKSN